MKVLFVYPTTPIKLFPLQYSQGIGYLSAVLKEKGHQTKLLALNKYDKKVISLSINSFQPHLIAVSSTSDQIYLAAEIINYMYKTYKLPIVLGGVHPTIAPQESINIPGVIGICIGEGEYSLLELVNKLKKGENYFDTKNFWFKINGKLIKNALSPLIQQLDSLPFPDRELFEDSLGDLTGVEFIAGRGCPYQCTYCINPYLQKIYKESGKFVRHRSVKNMLDEIKVVSRKYKPKSIIFHDDIFTLNRNWLKEFAHEYPDRIGIPFTCNVRTDTISPETSELLRAAGCEEVKVGIESGNDWIRDRVLNRKMDEKRIREVCNLLSNKGMRITTFNMVGIPYETENSIKETIALNQEIHPFQMSLSVFRPYQGTKLYEICKKNGWLSNRIVETYFDKSSILNLPSIAKDRISYYYALFRPMVYKSKLLPLIKLTLVVKIFCGENLYYSIHNIKISVRRWLPAWLRRLVKRILPLIRWI